MSLIQGCLGLGIRGKASLRVLPKQKHYPLFAPVHAWLLVPDVTTATHSSIAVGFLPGACLPSGLALDDAMQSLQFDWSKGTPESRMKNSAPGSPCLMMSVPALALPPNHRDSDSYLC